MPLSVSPSSSTKPLVMMINHKFVNILLFEDRVEILRIFDKERNGGLYNSARVSSVTEIY